MIPKASQRSNGADLATHLLRADQNERIEVAEIRGAVAGNLHGVFEEWELQARHLTRCDNSFYHVSVSPDPAQEPWTREMYEDYFTGMEGALGLDGQPRAIVFHEKDGREHAHVVWSRIQAEEGKAVHLAFDHRILMEYSKQFAREHGIELSAEYGRRRGAKQANFYERAQEEETGLSLEDHRQAVTTAWQISDSPRAFVKALEERGYILATGKRPYVVVDFYGHPHALPRMIDEKSTRTRDIQKFLGAAYPPEILPTVDEAKQVLARFANVKADAQRAEQREDELRELKRRQERRRAPLAEKQARQDARHKAAQERLRAKQERERREQRERFQAERNRRRIEREKRKPKGLAAFLGKVSGVNALRRQIHRYQDRKLLQAFRQDWQALKERQARQREALKQEQILQKRVLEKEDRAMRKIENREKRELKKKLARQYRRGQRPNIRQMPALAFDRKGELVKGGGLTKALNTASGKRSKVREKDQLTQEFSKAAKGKEKESEKEDKALEPVRRVRKCKPRRRRRDRDPGRER